MIQKTIRESFSDCTVLTIAHRLHTIIDSDRIALLDRGQLLEMDTPLTLLKDTKARLHQLCLVDMTCLTLT